MASFQKSFTITAPTGNDIWKKPPNWSLFNAASHCLPAKPLSKFKSAMLYFDAKWEFEYDQAGLILQLDSASGTHDRKWVKAGFEYYEGQVQVSTVACDRWADWSITALSNLSMTKEINILVERVEDLLGVSLWVYYVKEDGKRTPLREVCWFFDDDGTGTDWNLTVGAYASRPDYRQTNDSLVVEFKELRVEWSS